jgi:hypothetical protein
LNTCGSASSGMPIPSSATSRMACSSSRAILSRTRPPLGVYLIALSRSLRCPVSLPCVRWTPPPPRRSASHRGPCNSRPQPVTRRCARIPCEKIRLRGSAEGAEPPRDRSCCPGDDPTHKRRRPAYQVTRRKLRDRTFMRLDSRRGRNRPHGPCGSAWSERDRRPCASSGAHRRPRCCSGPRSSSPTRAR